MTKSWPSMLGRNFKYAFNCLATHILLHLFCSNINVVEIPIWAVFEDWIVTFRSFPSNLISEISITWLSDAFPVSVILPILRKPKKGK
jgi:hypothetical protein